MLTQEQKFFLQKVDTAGIEQARDFIRIIQSGSEIEKKFTEDLLVQLSGYTKKEYDEAVEESGIFYFFNDYSKGV